MICHQHVRDVDNSYREVDFDRTMVRADGFQIQVLKYHHSQFIYERKDVQTDSTHEHCASEMRVAVLR